MHRIEQVEEEKRKKLAGRKKKKRVKNVPPAFALNNGVSIAPSHKPRLDSVPLKGISKELSADWVPEETWVYEKPKVVADSTDNANNRVNAFFKGKAVFVAPK